MDVFSSDTGLSRVNRLWCCEYPWVALIAYNEVDHLLVYFIKKSPKYLVYCCFALEALKMERVYD